MLLPQTARDLDADARVRGVVAGVTPVCEVVIERRRREQVLPQPAARLQYVVTVATAAIGVKPPTAIGVKPPAHACRVVSSN